MKNSPNLDLMKPGEVAKMFGVHTKTVRRWVDSGHLKVIRLPGGQFRYRRDEVVALIEVN